MSVFRAAWAVLGVAACSYNPNRSTPGGGDDAPRPDTPMIFDSPVTCAAWTPQAFMPCDIGSPFPPPVFDETSYVYDTTTSGGDLRRGSDNMIVFSSPLVISQALTNGPDIALMNVETFTLPAGVEIDVIGPKPLLIASWDELVINGVLDASSITVELPPASSHIDGTQRAGANSSPAECGAAIGSTGTNANATGGSGGGGGGAFNSMGGGGAGGDNNPAITGGPGGTGLLTRPTVIRGGCRGGAAGTAGAGAGAPADATTFTNPGEGGGAIQLAARVRLEVATGGIVRANGGGGGGAPQGSACGGGGGGSGGYVGLDAPIVSVVGTVVANGGGGGGSAPFANDGNQGQNGGDTGGPAVGGPHHAGQPGGCGNAGANGGAGVAPNGDSTATVDGCGGGGGGGSAGWVVAFAGVFSNTGTISPTVIQP